MSIITESGVPIASTNRSGLAGKLRGLAVGDSVFVPESLHSRANVANGAQQVMKATGMKYTVRKCDGGHRAWRTA